MDVRGKKRRHHRSEQATVMHSSEKDAQVTVPIPDAVMEEYGLRPGDPVSVSIEGDHITVRRHASRLDGVAGTMPGLSELMDLENERESWEER